MLTCITPTTKKTNPYTRGELPTSRIPNSYDTICIDDVLKTFQDDDRFVFQNGDQFVFNLE